MNIQKTIAQIIIMIVGLAGLSYSFSTSTSDNVEILSIVGAVIFITGVAWMAVCYGNLDDERTLHPTLKQE